MKGVVASRGNEIFYCFSLLENDQMLDGPSDSNKNFKIATEQNEVNWDEASVPARSACSGGLFVPERVTKADDRCWVFPDYDSQGGASG